MLLVRNLKKHEMFSADVQFHSSVFITALIALSIVIDNTSQCTYKETKEKGVQH